MSIFKAEHWEAADEYIITMDGKPIGQTLSRRVAEAVARWLPTAEEDIRSSPRAEKDGAK